MKAAGVTLARPSRRRFLKQGAAVTVAFTLAPYFDAAGQGTGVAPAALPGSLQTNRQLDAWLAIDANGTVTVFTGKVELGQGITTALSQIVADELDVDLARIAMVSGDTSRTPNEGVTSGSLSIEQSGTALRFAAAEAREILLAAAATRLGVPAADLSVADGVVTAPDGKRTTYWDVTRADLLHREATAKAKPQASAAHKVIGTSVRRRDIPAKVTGGLAYVQDMRLPEMLFGRVVRPPSYRARLVSLDDVAVRAMPGVVTVVRNGSFVGVAAEREEQAIAAAQALAGAAKWSETADLPPSGDSAVRAHEARARAGFDRWREDEPGRRGEGRAAPRGRLHAAVHGARLDRTLLRRGAVARRQAHGVEPHAGRVSAARRPRQGTRYAAVRHRRHPSRGLRLLRAERRRRRRARRRAGRAGDERPAGEAAMDARRRVRVGAVRVGDDDASVRRPRRGRQRRRLAARAVEPRAQHASRRPRRVQSPRQLASRAPR